jgi:small subunit ribosomal protein S14
MTTSDFKKLFVQLKNKPAKLKKYLKHNAPKKRTTGSMLKKCKRCGRTGAHISKYGIHLCRQCFRETAKKMGFKKYS